MERTEPTLEDLKRLIELIKKHGIEEFKGFGFELKFDSTAIAPRRRRRTLSHNSTDLIGDGQLSDEELLFYSSAALTDFSEGT